MLSHRLLVAPRICTSKTRARGRAVLPRRLLDHVQPLGLNDQAIEVTPYRLTDDAAEVIEEWFSWFRAGVLVEDGVLAYFRDEMSRG